MYDGGSVPKWSADQIHNPATPGLSSDLTTTWICFILALSTNPGHACKQPIGILNNVMFNLNIIICICCLLSTTSLCAISTAKGKLRLLVYTKTVDSVEGAR